MMNRFIYFILLLGCVASALVGCTDDPDVEPLSPGRGDGSESWVTIDFCDNSFDKINITTRATLDNIAESRVANLFVFIFGPKTTDENGVEVEPRLYGRYFDYTNRLDSESELLESKEECWFVKGNAEETEPEGKVRIKAPAVENGSLYVLANINADMVNISPEKLRFVQNLSDLQALTASLNQQITERNGFFPMTGSATPVQISSGNIAIPNTNGNSGGKIMLTRLDAKVEVKLRVAKGYMDFTTNEITQGETSSTQSGTTEGGSDAPQVGVTTVKTLHKIESFVPLSWQVVNLPRNSFVLPRDTDLRNKDNKKDLFNTRETKFETRKSGIIVQYTQKEIDTKTLEYILKKDGSGEISTITQQDTTDEHGFSFYMLENRPKPQYREKIPTVNPNTKDTRLYDSWRYHLRDTRHKVDGVYAPADDGNIWEYAPEEGTYLVIKGEIVMALDISNEGKNQQLSADAVYYIHLGDFAKDKDRDGDGIVDSGVDDYSIERNTSYTYNITIYGVDNIQIEVEKKTEENESGATGHVYVAKESIFTFDSHFGYAEVSFDVGHLQDVDFLTWYVRTPFGREGAPRIINGVEVPSGLDYQWVHFVINDIEDGKYLTTIAKYDPEKVMNILEFSEYIKEQKHKFDADKEKDGKIDNESAFRREFDQDWYNKFGKPAGKKESDDGEWYRYRIHLTIFVDEFYYDANPLTGDVRQDLWKDFVNQPNRLMHILCDTDMSKDEASRATGSVVTIRQRSIQTIFNTQKPELKTAWGCETIDETRDILWYFSRDEKYDPKTGHLSIPEGAMDGAERVGNDSQGNGLYNTARIWGLLSGWDNATTYIPKLWSDYVDYNQTSGLRGDDPQTPQKENALIETMRYSCMTRNRDENGDNKIDAKEVKWYLAAISQLGSLYVGDQGLSSEAVLYPYYKQQVTDNVLDEKTGVYPWRAHIVSSTRYDGTGIPEILWAEEGLSTGKYNEAWYKYAGMSVRCVRNLGMDPIDEADAQRKIMDKEHNMPEQAIKVSGAGLGDRKGETVAEDSVYMFDLTNLNPLSIRYYTSQELEPNNELSVEARVYWAFKTGRLSEKSYTYDELFYLIRDGRSPCPEGYRAPNIREGALMSLRCPRDWQKNKPSRVSTYYSHGLRGTDQDPGSGGKSNSWFFTGDKTYLDNSVEQKVRCVKDVRR